MNRLIVTLIIVLIFTCFFNNNLYSIGTPAGTIITNTKSYNPSFSLPSGYFATLPGELIVIYTNFSGVTNRINGKYYYSNSIFRTNIKYMTVSAGYDISSIPSYIAQSGNKGSYVQYDYYITNQANTLNNFTIRVLPVATDDPLWVGNYYSLFINGQDYGQNQGSIIASTNNISAGELLNISVRLFIPSNVANQATNLFSFEIWNTAWNTNTSTGDRWPGIGAIPPVTPDTNDQRDYQISFIKTTANIGVYHTISVVSADDMIHTIYKFDGTEMLGNTRLKINIIMDTPPVDKENFYLVYNLDKDPTGNNSDDKKVKIHNDGVGYYAIIYADQDSRIRNGAQFNFMIIADGEKYYRDGMNGKSSWSFMIKSIIMQKNNISILKNLLNPRKGEKTILFYSLSKPSNVNIDIYTISGEKIITLFNGYQTSGLQTPLYWDGKNEAGREVGEGLYFINVRTEHINEIRKVIVVK